MHQRRRARALGSVWAKPALAGLAVGLATFILCTLWGDWAAPPAPALTIPEAQARSEAMHACLESAATVKAAAMCQAAADAPAAAPWPAAHRWPLAALACVAVLSVWRLVASRAGSGGARRGG